MLPFDTVHAISGRLLAAAKTGTLDALQPIAVLVLHARGENSQTDARVGIKRFPLSVLTAQCHKPEHMLHDVAEQLRAARDGSPLSQRHIVHVAAAVSDPRVLAWAVEYQQAAAAGIADMIHHVDAIDVDGRAYRISRVSSDAFCSITIDDDVRTTACAGPLLGLRAMRNAATVVAEDHLRPVMEVRHYGHPRLVLLFNAGARRIAHFQPAGRRATFIVAVTLIAALLARHHRQRQVGSKSSAR